jgi:hypothetical protein
MKEKKEKFQKFLVQKFMPTKKHDTTFHQFMNSKYAYIFRHNKALSWALLELGPCLGRLYIAQVLYSNKATRGLGLYLPLEYLLALWNCRTFCPQDLDL